MSSPGASEAQIYHHAFELISIHEALLKDAPRNRAFYQALAAHVKKGSTVLDSGSGTGLWAIMAAKLGASRVVAIEKDGLMCGIIRRLAEENGVGDRLTVVEGMSNEVVLDEKFDIVVSETIGHMIFDEDVVEIMIDAREHFLKPGGVMIPERVALVAAPLHLDEPREAFPVGLEAIYNSFQALTLHRPLAYLDKSAFRWLGEKAELMSADMRTVTARPDISALRAAWNLGETASLDGVAVWVELGLSEGVTLSTLDTPSWSVSVYRFAPFAAASGELQFGLELSAPANIWTATLGDEKQRLSPSIAATQMAMQHHVNPRLLPGLLMQPLIG
ncbi:MAG: methyltransferase domain containing protein [Verrucomicrobiaceae bacterium]|nr:methyltransferase domain containing protein [Verrucomicrobiaceae bacterium]